MLVFSLRPTKVFCSSFLYFLKFNARKKKEDIILFPRRRCPSRDTLNKYRLILRSFLKTHEKKKVIASVHEKRNVRSSMFVNRGSRLHVLLHLFLQSCWYCRFVVMFMHILSNNCIIHPVDLIPCVAQERVWFGKKKHFLRKKTVNMIFL